MWHGNQLKTLALEHCSFCRKRQDQVSQLTAGPGHLFICNECVDFYRERVEQGRPLSQWREWREWKTESVEPDMIIEPAHTDYEAIRRVVHDYVEGIEEADSTKIERSVHPDLKNRGFPTAKEGSPGLITLVFTELPGMEDITQKEGNTPKGIDISDFSGQIATVKLTAWWGTDYLHLVRDQKCWMIVNILRHLHPSQSNWLDPLDE